MIVVEYAYLAVRSDDYSPRQLSGVIGIQPDRELVRGARRPAPPVPATNSWIVGFSHSSEEAHELELTAQIEWVVRRVRPAARRILRLQESSNTNAVLQIVREFREDDSPTCDASAVQAAERFVTGFHIDVATLEMLSLIRAPVDVDEYYFGRPDSGA